MASSDGASVPPSPARVAIHDDCKVSREAIGRQRFERAQCCRLLLAAAYCSIVTVRVHVHVTEIVKVSMLAKRESRQRDERAHHYRYCPLLRSASLLESRHFRNYTAISKTSYFPSPAHRRPAEASIGEQERERIVRGR